MHSCHVASSVSRYKPACASKRLDGRETPSVQHTSASLLPATSQIASDSLLRPQHARARHARATAFRGVGETVQLSKPAVQQALNSLDDSS